MTLAQCAGIVAPYYNLGLVIIVVILFFKLFKTHTPENFTKPWYLLFGALCLFILETVLTILKHASLIDYPAWINPVLELAMLALFIYMVLIQKDHVKENY